MQAVVGNDLQCTAQMNTGGTAAGLTDACRCCCVRCSIAVTAVVLFQSSVSGKPLVLLLLLLQSLRCSLLVPALMQWLAC
jgi:hypothetical protein